MIKESARNGNDNIGSIAIGCDLGGTSHPTRGSKTGSTGEFRV